MALSKPMEMMAAATAAGVGGFLSTSILYPLDTLKTRIQSGASLLPEDDDKEPSSKKKNKQVALIKSLYQGIQFKAAESSTSKFLYFYSYTMLAQMVAPKDGKPIGTLTDLGIGYLSELCHLPITMPMELVGTRMQTGSESGSILQILRSIVKESGVGGLYKGLGAYFVLCLQPAIQYTVFERLKGVYLRKFKQASQALGALEAFVLGAIARSFATLVLFPYIRAKVLMQANKKKQSVAAELEDGRAGTCAEPKKETIASTLQRVYTEEGPLALYRGLGPELTRGALSSALMLMIKEKIQMYITLVMIIVNSAYTDPAADVPTATRCRQRLHRPAGIAMQVAPMRSPTVVDKRFALLMGCSAADRAAERKHHREALNSNQQQPANADEVQRRPPLPLPQKATQTPGHRKLRRRRKGKTTNSLRTGHMCWWCCMRVLEKCLPRNDIVRELAPYLQHVHQDDAGLDDETRRGADTGGPWVRSQSPRGLDKDSATSSDSLRHVNANYPLRHSLDCELSLQDCVGVNPNQSRPLTKMSVRKPDSDSNQDQDYASATLQKEQCCASAEISAAQVSTQSSQNSGQERDNPTLLRLARMEAESSSYTLEVSGSEYSFAGSNNTMLGKKSVNKIKTDLGDLTPVRWEKVVIVQVSVQGFREMMTKAKDLMEDAKLLYEHTVLSRLASEYGGQEILSHSRSGLFVIAFASEFHAAKWCLSLQLSLVYAAWNDKLLKEFEDMKEMSVTTNGKTKKNMLLYRGFRVRMVIHTAEPDISPDLALCEAVKWTQTVSEYAHGGQIILSDNVWDRLKEQLVQLGNPVVEDLGCHAVLGDEVLLMLLLPRDVELRRFPSLKSPHQLSLGMRDAPSAQKPVTMVFTFIEGARPLVRCHAEELADRIKTLCMVARELLRTHNGYECQELQGDFMLAFFTPASAILWCGEFQMRIRQRFREWDRENENQELRFSMSMGIETGLPASVSPHKTSGRADYFGNIVNQTARIAKAAHGGQVLIGGDAWGAFCTDQKARPSLQIITKTEKIKDVPGTTVFQFKAHGYYNFKGISKPIGLVEAIPIDVQSPMLKKLDPMAIVRGHAPKAKRIEDTAQAKTTVPDVPTELVRLSHGGEHPNNSIRETEVDFNLSWNDSIFVFEDIDEEDGEAEGEGHARGGAVCGSVALAMRNSTLNHSQLMAMLRSSGTDGSSTPSQRSSATPTRTEDMNRV